MIISQNASDHKMHSGIGGPAAQAGRCDGGGLESRPGLNSARLSAPHKGIISPLRGAPFHAPAVNAPACNSPAFTCPTFTSPTFIGPVGNTGDVHLYIADGQAASDDVIRPYQPHLSDNERQRAASMRHEGRRRQFLRGRVLARLALGRHCPYIKPQDFAFHVHEFGKPSVHGQGANVPYFNLTHTERYSAIAVSHHVPVGFDIEPVHHYEAYHLSNEQLTSNEIAHLASMPAVEKARHFIGIWTVKEAVYKWLGVGASLPFDQVEVNAGLDGVRFFTKDAGVEVMAVQQWFFEVDGVLHSAALALESPTQMIG